MIDQSNNHPQQVHNQNIRTAFQLNDVFNQIELHSDMKADHPVEKLIKNTISPHKAILTNQFVHEGLTVEQLFVFSAYPELQKLYIEISKDLMDTMSVPLTLISDGKYKMNSQELSTLFELIVNKDKIYEKIAKMILMIKAPPIRTIYKRRFFQILCNKCSNLLTFTGYNIDDDIFQKVIYNQYCIDAMENSQQNIKQRNSTIIGKLAENFSKVNPFGYEKLAKKILLTEISDRFIDQKGDEKFIRPVSHWKDLQTSVKMTDPLQSARQSYKEVKTKYTDIFTDLKIK